MVKKEFTQQHQNLKKALFNYVNSIDKYKNKYTLENYIKELRKELHGIIDKNKSWMSGTKEGYYFMLSRYFYVNEGVENHYHKYYAQTGYDIMMKRRGDEGENKLDEKEKKYFRDYNFCIMKMKELESHKDDNIYKHYQYLLLALLTQQEPIRTSFYITAKYITKKEDNDGINNFIKVDRRGNGNVYYIVNHDKVTNTKTYNMNKELSTIKIENRDLVKIIIDSFDKHKRTYLFENPKTKKQYEDRTILRFLRESLDNEGININMMRAAYINYYYSKNLTLNEKEEIARKMRHSVITATRNYYKIEITKDERILELEVENDELKKEIESLQEKIKQMEIKHE
jgi:hypothetical protein